MGVAPTPSHSTVTVVSPGPAPVISPVVLRVTTDASPVIQRTCAEASAAAPSEKRASALSCIVSPTPSTTDGGLMVPVVRHAEARDVWDCANEMRRVSQAAREKTATTEELSGSTITITSLGALGGLGATPIINHPEVAIIGVHKAEERAVVRDGNIVVRRMMNLSGSFDHRVVDGYDGARMMQTLKQMLEHPATIFI